MTPLLRSLRHGNGLKTLTAVDTSRTVPRRRLFWAIYAGYLTVLLFITYRVALWLFYAANPIGLSTAVNPYRSMYPELFVRGIVNSQPDGVTYRVLLLGGSVAEQTGNALEEMLCEKMKQPVKVYNAASAALTTRDSLNKLEYLAECKTQFDLIIVYHGINDVNLNRYPADVFREDYTHSGWYNWIETMRKNPHASIQNVVRDSFRRVASATEEQEFDWGNDIKTPPAFEANLRSMIRLAEQEDTPIVLATFANYIPPNYTVEAFRAGELGYGKGEFGHPTTVWGWTENVRDTIAAHNEAIRRVVADHSELPFVDLQSIIIEPKDFCDVCHLTESGITLFAESMTAAILDSGISLVPRKPSVAATQSPDLFDRPQLK